MNPQNRRVESYTFTHYAKGILGDDALATPNRSRMGLGAPYSLKMYLRLPTQVLEVQDL